MMEHLGIITTSFPSGEPGTEAAGSFVYDFVTQLSSKLNISLFAPSLENSVSSAGNLKIYRFAVPILPLSSLKPSNPSHWLAIKKTLTAGSAMTQNILKNQKIDHVLALWALPSGYWARRLKSRYKVDYSVWALGSDIWDMRSKPFINFMLANVLKDAKFRFADGMKLARDVTEISGLDCQFLPSCRKISNANKIQKHQDPPFNIAYLGRWHPNKGIDLFIDCLLSLNNNDWACINEIRIFGGGPLEDSINCGVKKLKLSSRPVNIGGYLSKNLAIDLLDWADYLVIPSRIESIPVIFSDAMQIGTPVISTPVGDLAELIRKYKCGILSADVTSKSFLDALKKALKTRPSEFQKGIEMVENIFSIEESVKKYIKIISQNGV